MLFWDNLAKLSLILIAAFCNKIGTERPNENVRAHGEFGRVSGPTETLDIPLSSVNGAPIRVDGAWVHWACLPWFSRARWDTAKVALQRLGIAEQVF
jgi:hypothetical protein